MDDDIAGCLCAGVNADTEKTPPKHTHTNTLSHTLIAHPNTHIQTANDKRERESDGETPKQQPTCSDLTGYFVFRYCFCASAQWMRKGELKR